MPARIPDVQEFRTVGDTFPLILLAAMMLLFWAVVIRPQRKQQQRMAELQGGLAPGDRVMLSSGLFGTVAEVLDDRVRLEIAAGTVIEVLRQAVIRTVEPAEGVTEDHRGDHPGPARTDDERPSGA